MKNPPLGPRKAENMKNSSLVILFSLLAAAALPLKASAEPEIIFRYKSAIMSPGGDQEIPGDDTGGETGDGDGQEDEKAGMILGPVENEDLPPGDDFRPVSTSKGVNGSIYYQCVEVEGGYGNRHYYAYVDNSVAPSWFGGMDVVSRAALTTPFDSEYEGGSYPDEVEPPDDGLWLNLTTTDNEACFRVRAYSDPEDESLVVKFFAEDYSHPVLPTDTHEWPENEFGLVFAIVPPGVVPPGVLDPDATAPITGLDAGPLVYVGGGFVSGDEDTPLNAGMNLQFTGGHQIEGDLFSLCFHATGGMGHYQFLTQWPGGPAWLESVGWPKPGDPYLWFSVPAPYMQDSVNGNPPTPGYMFTTSDPDACLYVRVTDKPGKEPVEITIFLNDWDQATTEFPLGWPEVPRSKEWYMMVSPTR